MSANNQVCGDFGVAFNNIEKVIEFNSAWTQGYSGYWDGAITGEQAISLNAGEVAKTIDGHGRRAIFIGTPSGVVVLFDRYRPENGEPYGWINYQVPGCKKLRWFFGQAGQCNLHQLYQLIEAGNPSSNVGVALSNE